MDIVIAGGTGLIGRELSGLLSREGHRVTVLSRRERPAAGGVSYVPWDARRSGPWEAFLEKADGVVNLTGESIAQGRWSAARKQILRDSRILSTRILVDALGRAAKRPRALLNASAVGDHGSVPEGEMREDMPQGSDFLARLCGDWESEARKAEGLGMRVVLLRFGVVLGKGGGALPKMALPFKLFAGGPVGNGRQWFPWVHVRDVAGAALFSLQNETVRGPVNVTAPGILTNRDFSTALGRALHRPSWAPVPGFVLKAALGEMAEMLLTGQKAAPARLLESGYGFRFPEAGAALEDVLG